MIKHRRRNYLIKTGLQLRYMGIIVIAMLLVALFVGWITYHTTWSSIANAPDLTLNKLAGIFDSVNYILLRWVAVFVCIIALSSVFISHKIAGPVYRLEETAKQIASGDLTGRVHLRQGDELTDLQDAFNTMADSLASMINKDREIISGLAATSKSLSSSIEKGTLSQAELKLLKTQMDKITQELENVSSGFKTENENKDGQSASAERNIKKSKIRKAAKQKVILTKRHRAEVYYIKTKLHTKNAL